MPRFSFVDSSQSSYAPTDEQPTYDDDLIVNSSSSQPGCSTLASQATSVGTSAPVETVQGLHAMYGKQIAHLQLQLSLAEVLLPI